MPQNQPRPSRRNMRGRGVSQAPTFDAQFVEDYFVYSIDFTNLDAGQSDNGQIQIQADSDFKWVSAIYYITIADAVFTAETRPMPNITVQITDSGSGRQLFNQPVPVPSVFGQGVLPYMLPIPRIFKARSSIAFAIANFDAAQDDYNLRLALVGTKIFTL